MKWGWDDVNESAKIVFLPQNMCAKIILLHHLTSRFITMFNFSILILLWPYFAWFWVKLGRIPEGFPSFWVKTLCSIKRLQEEEELCCWKANFWETLEISVLLLNPLVVGICNRRRCPCLRCRPGYQPVRRPWQCCPTCQRIRMWWSRKWLEKKSG